jgi:O-antigen/teichoic acid export membrane protein
VRIPSLVRRVRPRGEFSRNVLTLVAGTGFSQIIIIASSPLLTRLYAPADYGVYAVAMSIMAILMTVTCLRYEYAVPLPEADETAANIVALALLINLGMSVTSFVVLGLAGASILVLLNAAALGPYVLLITLGQFGGGAASTLTTWAVRTKTFSQIAAKSVTQTTALVVVQVGLGIVGAGAPGLLLGDVAGRFSGTGRLAKSAWRTNAAAFRRISRAGIATAARRYKRFPILSSPSALLNALGVQMPLLAIVAFYGTAAGGQFALADRVCSMPLALVAGAVSQVYLAEAARNAREEPRAVRSLFLRATLNLARLAIGPAILLALLAPFLAGLVFGADWTETGLFIAILAPMYYVTFVTAATGDTLYVLERLDLQLAREVMRLALLGGAVPLAAALGLSALGAVAVLSAAGCLTYVLYGLISWYAVVDAPRHGLPGKAPESEALNEVVAAHASGDDTTGIV